MTQANPAAWPSGGRDPLSPSPRPGDFTLDRWDVLQLVKDCARALGIGEREIGVLSAHLSLLPKGPVRAADLCMSYAEIAGILDRANCMDERRFRRGETRLAEIGLIARRLSGNGRRFPVRDGRGQIVDAYGIDLRPLFLRVPDLERLRLRLAEESARRRALKSRISARLAALRKGLGDGLSRMASATLDDLQRLCRRSAASLAELTAAEARLAELETGIGQQAAGNCAASLPDSPAADAGQIDRRMESQTKETKTSPGPERQPDPGQLWALCPRIAAYFPDPPRTLTALSHRVFEFLGFLGLGPERRQEVLSLVPIADLLRLLDGVLGNLNRIADPGGYLVAAARNRAAGARPTYDRGHKLHRCGSRA